LPNSALALKTTESDNVLRRLVDEDWRGAGRFFSAIGKLGMTQEALESSALGRHRSADPANLNSAPHA